MRPHAEQRFQSVSSKVIGIKGHMYSTEIAQNHFNAQSEAHHGHSWSELHAELGLV